MLRVIIESPFAAPDAAGIEANVAYARKAMLDSLGRGEAPYASHLLFPQVLDDADADQRRLGIEAGLAWGRWAACSVFYVDRGISDGMRQGFKAAEGIREIKVRWIENGPPSEVTFRACNHWRALIEFEALVALGAEIGSEVAG